MDNTARLKRLSYRAWHRGTKEADMMLGGFFDARSAEWSDSEVNWFEALLEEQDVDIMAWAIGLEQIPEKWRGPMMTDLRKLDFIKAAR